MACALSALLGAIPRLLLAQGVPLGPEFVVNTQLQYGQRSAQVAFDAAGNFVVVWTGDYHDGDGPGIAAQRFSSSGSPLGGELSVNTHTSSSQIGASVASDAAGNFVVVWQSLFQDGSGTGIFGQRYESTGLPRGGEFRVNSTTASDQRSPSVASDAQGNFVVVWFGPDGWYNGAFGQRFGSSGAPLGPEFRVNTYTTRDQLARAVASDSAGNFVVTWTSYGQDGSQSGLFAQRFSASGGPLGPEFRLNAFTPGNQAGGSVASTADGSFVVTWSSYGQDGSGQGVFGRRFASTGAPLGLSEFQANAYAIGHQSQPTVAIDAGANFVVVWTSQGQDGSNDGIFGRRYTSAGDALGGEFRVNTYTTSFQRLASVAAAPAGTFVVAWESDDGYYAPNIRAQRYSPILPVEVQSFVIE